MRKNKRLYLFFLTSLISLGLEGQMDSLWSKLKFDLDFRFRTELDWDSKKSNGSYRKNRSRLRYRLRTGVIYIHDLYSFGFRIRTGDPNKQQDPQLTLGTGFKEFGTLPIGFEKLFFQTELKSFEISLGKNDFPFHKNNELFWSDNVYPEGISVGKSMDISNGIIHQLGFNIGHFILASNNKSLKDDAYFQGFQSYINLWNETITVFPSLYLFRNIPNIPDGGHTSFLDYSIIHLGGKINFNRNIPLLLDFDFYNNVETYGQKTDISSNFLNQKQGFTIGIQLGKLKEAKSWQVKLTYAHLEKYSILDYMAQNDWARWDYSSFNSPDGRLSNFKGIEFSSGFAISNKINLIAKYYNVNQLVSPTDDKETGQRFRFDLNVKF